ncbi:aldo/keto reductase [Muricauda sp. SCSIO 64092]|uniref:aldo/keto reductase n=1 Tax=Allomuricauda sp. SCSIO 64092 TaxID=2908842 RepID=UPI001FF6E91C|nr:aldo/keto reductase [Muricauda sp. SCSIO 64092]UOY08558.1 aldo/keto reductase [Muricauda sp. SCSIO 64092]
MKYKLLGNTGLRVSEVALGTMTFGTEAGWGADKETSRKMFDAFVNAGGNFVDTANEIYTGGTSEKFTGEFIKSNREYIVLGTKYTDAMPGNDPNRAGNSRKNMMQSLERSLKRLDTDYVDVFWVHAWDFMSPVQEVMRALDDMVRQGKVLYLGISDAPAWVISKANMYARMNGLTPFEASQIEYSLIQRTGERDLLPMAKSEGMTTLGWSPLASGILTGKYSQKNGKANNPGNRRLDTASFVALTDRNLAIGDKVVEIAERNNIAPSAVAIAYVKQKDIIPILGGTKASHIESNLRSIDFELSAEDIRELDEISAMELGFPYDFLKSTQAVTYGGQFENIVHNRPFML